MNKNDAEWMIHWRVMSKLANGTVPPGKPYYPYTGIWQPKPLVPDDEGLTVGVMMVLIFVLTPVVVITGLLMFLGVSWMLAIPATLIGGFLFVLFITTGSPIEKVQWLNTPEGEAYRKERGLS